MSVASMRYGTIRRLTALTTDSFEGFIRHASSGGSSVGFVMTDMGAPAHRGPNERHRGPEQRIPGPARRSASPRQGPARSGLPCLHEAYT